MSWRVAVIIFYDVLLAKDPRANGLGHPSPSIFLYPLELTGLQFFFSVFLFLFFLNKYQIKTYYNINFHHGVEDQR